MPWRQMFGRTKLDLPCSRVLQLCRAAGCHGPSNGGLASLHEALAPSVGQFWQVSSGENLRVLRPKMAK